MLFFPIMGTSSNSGCGCFLIVVLVFVLGGLLAYVGLDQEGWVPHTDTVDMYMMGNWMNGENRVCAGLHNGTGSADGEITALYCPDGSGLETPHNFTVKFWGKVRRPARNKVEVALGSKHMWNCTRHSDEFVCKALD